MKNFTIYRIGDGKILHEVMACDFGGAIECAKKNLRGASLSSAFLHDLNLSRANLSEADLFGANLIGANLSGADLTRANLSGANLARVNLSRANLSGANLSRANLSGANLSGAILIGTDLFGANLIGANLSGADLTRAYLGEADLFGAILVRANLSGANLIDTRGMVKVIGVEKGNVYWKRFDTGLKNNGFQFYVGINTLRSGEIFASDERTMCSFPGFHFASRSWCSDNYPSRPLEARIRIPETAKINEPWATDGKASASEIEILQVFDVATGKDVTNEYLRP